VFVDGDLRIPNVGSGRMTITYRREAALRPRDDPAVARPHLARRGLQN
jgi:hypothetical protein